MINFAGMTSPELIATAIIAGVARWEKGELCFRGGRHCVELEANLLPMLSASTFDRLVLAMEDHVGTLVASNIRMVPIPDFGEHWTIEEFSRRVKTDMLVDYDGSGYYATESKASNVRAFPSEIVAGNINRKFTHVMWYNK
jgi:hypothetical protein